VTYYGSPAYTNVDFPFPIDPLYVPDENPTGDYRAGRGVPRQPRPPASAVYLNLDAAHQGIGSASCGPGVLPARQLRPGPLTFGLTFEPV
jgi:hypothetical protein